jgi:hypothetical protein
MKHLVNVKVTLVVNTSVVIEAASFADAWRKAALMTSNNDADIPLFHVNNCKETVTKYKNVMALAEHMEREPDDFSGFDDADIQVTIDDDKEYLRMMVKDMSRYEGGEGI